MVSGERFYGLNKGVFMRLITTFSLIPPCYDVIKMS